MVTDRVRLDQQCPLGRIGLVLLAAYWVLGCYPFRDFQNSRTVSIVNEPYLNLLTKCDWSPMTLSRPSWHVHLELRSIASTCWSAIPDCIIKSSLKQFEFQVLEWICIKKVFPKCSQASEHLINLNSLILGVRFIDAIST